MLETYLVDYRLQRWLVATLPVLVLLLILPISWLAALVLIATMPLIPLFMWLVGKGTVALQQRHILALDRLGSLFGDRLLGRQTIRLHNAGAMEIERFSRASESLNDRLAAVLRVAFLSGSVLDFFSTLSIALVAVFTGFALLGEVRIGFYGQQPPLSEALFLLLIAPAFFSELKVLGQLYHSRSDALAAAAAWGDVIADPSPPAENAEPGAGALPLRVDDAAVLALEGHELLHIDHLELKPGDRILLRGPSGTGKTALLEALAGLRQLHGTLGIGGAAHSSLAAPRDQVLLLEQEPTLFPGSVAMNVGLGLHSDEAIRSSIRRVGLGDWLAALEQGLATAMDDTPMLSGGQRQRLALARLLLFRPLVILLDEPSAHLSPDERHEINELLQELLSDTTLVWASHEALPERWFTRTWTVEKQRDGARLRA